MLTTRIRDVTSSLISRLPRVRPWSLRLSLAFLVASLALPLSILFIALLGFLAESNREAQRASLLYTARSLLAAVDAQLGRGMAVAKILAASPNIVVEDLSAFAAEARRASIEGTWIVVSSPDGKQLLNTAAAPGAELPLRTAAGIAIAKEALQSRNPVVSGIIRAPVRHIWSIAIDVPIFRNGEPYCLVTVAMDAEIFHTLLGAHNMPKGWLTGIIDREGRFVARVPDNTDKVGQFAAAGWRAIMDREGLFEFSTLEGDDVAHANARSALSGWSVGVASKIDEIEAAAWQTLALAISLGIVVCLGSIALAVAFARQITTSISDLRDRSRALIEGRKIESEGPTIQELADFWSALEEAIALRTHSDKVRQQQEEQIHMLMREVNHRSKNVLAVVQSIARNTAKSTPDQFVERFSERVLSLAASHDLLVTNNWRWTDLHELVRAQLAHLGDLLDTRIRISGPHIQLSAAAAQILGMTLHELATNASKYGALANESGTVEIAWNWAGEGTPPPIFKMSWVERGGPPASPPQAQGFGSTVIDRLVCTTLSGTVVLDYACEGFSWALECPSESLGAKD